MLTAHAYTSIPRAHKRAPHTIPDAPNKGVHLAAGLEMRPVQQCTLQQTKGGTSAPSRAACAQQGVSQYLFRHAAAPMSAVPATQASLHCQPCKANMQCKGQVQLLLNGGKS